MRYAPTYDNNLHYLNNHVDNHLNLFQSQDNLYWKNNIDQLDSHFRSPWNVYYTLTVYDCSYLVNCIIWCNTANYQRNKYSSNIYNLKNFIFRVYTLGNTHYFTAHCYCRFTLLTIRYASSNCLCLNGNKIVNIIGWS